MYSAFLSVLLLGLWPQFDVGFQDIAMLSEMHIAPPAKPLTVAQRLSASGVLILDAESGQTVYAKQADVERPMASITKLMTALIITEHHDMDEVVTVPNGIENVIGNKVYLSPGDTFRVGDLVSAVLISSANDAAVTLAIHHSGSEAAFAEEMNLRAKQLGLTETSYANASGLDDELQYSTPRDIAWLTAFMQRNEHLASRMQKTSQRIYSLQGTEVALSHTHVLLHSASSPVVAGKTGTTDGAQECLVSVVDVQDKQYIVVILRSGERYEDMRRILAAIEASVV